MYVYRCDDLNLDHPHHPCGVGRDERGVCVYWDVLTRSGAHYGRYGTNDRCNILKLSQTSAGGDTRGDPPFLVCSLEAECCYDGTERVRESVPRYVRTILTWTHNTRNCAPASRRLWLWRLPHRNGARAMVLCMTATAAAGTGGTSTACKATATAAAAEVGAGGVW